MDPAAAAELADWLARGDQALRALAPDVEPVLWPEHFDLGIQLDEVNYGISPGDAGHPRPYAYVGPWKPAHRTVLECAVRCAAGRRRAARHGLRCSRSSAREGRRRRSPPQVTRLSGQFARN